MPRPGARAYLPVFLLPMVLASGVSCADERPKLAVWVVCDGSAGSSCEAIASVAEGYARAFGDLVGRTKLDALPASSETARAGPGVVGTSRVNNYLQSLGAGTGKVVPEGADGLLLVDLKRLDRSKLRIEGSVYVVPKSGRWIGASADASPLLVWNGEGKGKTEKLLLRGAVGGALWNAGLLPSAPASRPFATSESASVFGDAVMEIPPGLFF